MSDSHVSLHIAICAQITGSKLPSPCPNRHLAPIGVSTVPQKVLTGAHKVAIAVFATDCLFCYLPSPPARCQFPWPENHLRKSLCKREPYSAFSPQTDNPKGSGLSRLPSPCREITACFQPRVPQSPLKSACWGPGPCTVCPDQSYRLLTCTPRADGKVS